MRKRSYLVAVVGAVALIVAGSLFASNMGFKLNKVLEGPGTNGSATGSQRVALPFNQQTNLVTASDLRLDIINSGGTGVAIAKFLPDQNDTLLTYSGGALDLPRNFDLTPAEGYIIQVAADSTYIIVGSHDPGLVVNLDGPGTNGSATGSQDYAFPYHGVANNASDLRDEILLQAPAGTAVAIAQFLPNQNDTLLTYGGGALDLPRNFDLDPGTSYIVQVSQDVAYIPQHY